MFNEIPATIYELDEKRKREGKRKEEKNAATEVAHDGTAVPQSGPYRSRGPCAEVLEARIALLALLLNVLHMLVYKILYKKNKLNVNYIDSFLEFILAKSSMFFRN